jgi:hypothetical protein
MAEAQALRKAVECGVPDNDKYMHPTLLKNRGVGGTGNSVPSWKA